MSVSVGWEYRLDVDRFSPITYLVTNLVEAQTLSGLEVGVRLEANESELEAPLCHYLTPPGGLVFVLPSHNKIRDTHNYLCRRTEKKRKKLPFLGPRRVTLQSPFLGPVVTLPWKSSDPSLERDHGWVWSSCLWVWSSCLWYVASSYKDTYSFSSKHTEWVSTLSQG